MTAPKKVDGQHPAQIETRSGRRSPPNVRGGWIGLLLSWLMVAALGGAAGWALAFQPEPETESLSLLNEVTYPLTSTDFTDARSVVLSLERGDPYRIRVRTAGTITAWSCSPVNTWSSGDLPMAIDGQFLVALTTTTPMYRDLVEGESGADVAAVQAALADLGYDNPGSGEYDAITREAVARFLTDRDMQRREGTPKGALLLQDVLWLPSSPVSPTSCDAGLGQAVGDGDTVVTTSGDITAVTYPNPDDLHEGPRQITVDGHSVPVAKAGRVTDDALIAWLGEQPGVGQTSAQVEGDTIAPTVSARLELTKPIEVYGVPPSALIGVSRDSACVSDGDVTIPVNIVASGLGIAYVAFYDGEAPQEVLLQPRRNMRCG